MYYVDIGKDLVGGAVKFRAPGEPPSPGYQKYCEARVDVSVPAEQNGILVFANSMPHRLRLMGNKGSESQSRTFLNFFVVDPQRRLSNTGIFFTERGMSAFLTICIRKLTGKTMPKDVLGLILRYLNLFTDMRAAKDFRTKAREAMKATRSGPGFLNMHYGNCGVQKFVENIDCVIPHCNVEGRLNILTDSATPSNGEVEDEVEEEE